MSQTPGQYRRSNYTYTYTCMSVCIRIIVWVLHLASQLKNNINKGNKQVQCAARRLSRLYLYFLPPAHARAHLFFFLTSPSRMPMLMKETRLTRQKSIAEIYARNIEKERKRQRERIYIVREEKERIRHCTQRVFPAGPYTFRDAHTHIQHPLFPLSLSFGFFYCIIYALCLSSRAHRIELLIVGPTKKSEKSAIQEAKFFFFYLSTNAQISIHISVHTNQLPKLLVSVYVKVPDHMYIEYINKEKSVFPR